MIQMTRKMQHRIKTSMQLTKDMDFSLRSRTRVMTASLCSVGLVARIITGDIFHKIKVVNLKFIVLKRHRQLGILGKIFLQFMQHWIIGRLIIKHLLSRWKVGFFIKLFIFLLTLDLTIVTSALTEWISGFRVNMYQ